jgi:hypothetical protein
MSYYVYIRHAPSGLIKKIKQDFNWNDSSEYWWTEVMGCDCNRRILFGDFYSSGEHNKCGNEEYLLEKIVSFEGVILSSGESSR